MVIKGAFFVTFRTLIENVSFKFYFKSVNGAIVLEAQLMNTTEISEYEHVSSQRLLRLSCNVVQQGVNSTQARVNIRSASGVTACRTTEAGSQGGETAQRDRWWTPKGSVHLVMMLGIGCIRQGPQSELSVPESAFQIPHLLPTDSTR